MSSSQSASAGHRHGGEFLRFVLVGVVNTGVGYGIYALCIYLGLNIFLSQAIGHVLGTLFNFAMHKAFVFRESSSSLLRYTATSGVNYLAGLLFLFLVSRMVTDPYLAGILAVVLQAFFSYLSLKFIAFRGQQQGH